MNKKINKNILTRIIYNPKFLALVGFIIIILISFPLAKNVSKRYKVNQEIKDLELEITEHKSKNRDLKELIKYLESDQFVEEQARLNLGLKKPGEEVLVIKEKELENTGAEKVLSANNNNKIDLKNISNYKKWFYYFFN